MKFSSLLVLVKVTEDSVYMKFILKYPLSREFLNLSSSTTIPLTTRFKTCKRAWGTFSKLITESLIRGNVRAKEIKGHRYHSAAGNNHVLFVDVTEAGDFNT